MDFFISLFFAEQLVQINGTCALLKYDPTPSHLETDTEEGTFDPRRDGGEGLQSLLSWLQRNDPVFLLSGSPELKNTDATSRLDAY